MRILGLSCYYHDAAAALIDDGRIVAAADEERFSRKKHDSSFPKKAIAFCLKSGKIKTDDLDYVVFYEKPFRKFHRILISSLAYYPRSCASFREAMRVWFSQKLWVKDEIASHLKLDPSKILFCEHHLSHAASCFYPSPFKKAAILTVDGVGEWATASWGQGQGNKINIRAEMDFPASLGLLYSAFTAFLGFEVNEGEWKVMGLAPYGKPKYADKIWKTVRQLADGSFSLDLSYFSFHYSDKKSFSSKLVDLFGEPVPPEKSYLITQRSADLAASIQTVTEKLLLYLTRNIKRETGSDNLCLAGGVALNCVANYRIFKESGFKNIYIQPAAGDSGGALGAALYVYNHVLGKKKRQIMASAYLGEEFSNEEIRRFLKTEELAGDANEEIQISTSLMRLPRKKLSSFIRGQDPLNTDKWKNLVSRMQQDELISFVVNKLCQGQVVGWLQGRFEWGPRALGARSILADPRNPKMKEIINSKVKFREAFRPFAPSVLAEHASKVFDLSAFKLSPRWRSGQASNHYPLRYMLYVVPVKEAWRKKVPAINHADNTARPQLVYKKENPLYYKLISAFYRKTGVPLLLNTSFNLKGEPIVNTPSDAYSTFTRSGIDVLVMGNYVVEKK